jgi:phage baseplate assembly protein W
MANNAVALKMIQNQPLLLDLNNSYGGTSDQLIIAQVEAVIGEIDNVMSTRIGEEWWEPTYGSNIPNRVFDPINATTAWLLSHDLQDALARWVPQVQIDTSKSSVVPFPDLRAYVVTISFAIVINGATVAYTYTKAVGPG